ncbi:TIGR00730 family Rossman fold protein [Maribellus sp. YY47]|uniref:LOG family protein n=1 Tax=Maribellus sp. YY47 TaxID=2929486 RepID=UPI00200151F0|nr:TIGR00730 family Rossman fold protein [Maribellus sp. YY47]MCK3685242.1 TIGR00730 family Rossman fold protein [Maribellus sp. YY47]
MNICVFCSSSNAISTIYFDEAQKLGALIGKNKHVLINGGANVGLMEAVTIAASKAGAKTIGIIPEKMIRRSLASDNSHEVIVTKDMMERKAQMRELSDAFIALPGGFGTLEEILEVITLRQLSYHHKPIVFINTNGFFDHLFKQFEVSYTEQFAKPIYRELYYVATNVEDAIDHIENYKEIELDSKWFVVPEK